VLGTLSGREFAIVEKVFPIFGPNNREKTKRSPIAIKAKTRKYIPTALNLRMGLSSIYKETQS
jgi:hypothetical protein